MFVVDVLMYVLTCVLMYVLTCVLMYVLTCKLVSGLIHMVQTACYCVSLAHHCVSLAHYKGAAQFCFLSPTHSVRIMCVCDVGM